MFGQYMTHDGIRLMQHEDSSNWVSPVVTLIIVLIIAAVAVYLIKTITATRTSHISDQSDPLIVAKLRFAKGEISKTEFDEIKKEI